MTQLTNLDILNNVDNYPQHATNAIECERPEKSHYCLLFEDIQGRFSVGFLASQVVDALTKLPTELASGIEIDHQNKTVLAFTEPTESERTTHVAAIVQHWQSHRVFKVLKHFRNEMWPVYGRDGITVLYSIERVAVGLFGANRYGAHLNSWVRSSDSRGGIKLWIGRRAADKPTYPRMLDNTAAGGMVTGEDPLECIIREADEEASLPESIIRQNIIPSGFISYIALTHSKHEDGGELRLLYPECQWIYDIELPEGLTPTPKDGEVEAFYLWTVDQVLDQLHQGNFKPNCGLLLLDFFIRHGIMTKDDDPDFDEIKARLRRPLPFPGPHEHIQV
ncbi:hypothetical protein Cpir12675_001666 [Ceratocystis pirilliformis]|uniref:Nudix hydrolase domain-containing protein n=1 Tax=Ceratocystis pirilliformis TaxID=259994 RepID=A0ABR3ZG30_9PEZI